MSRVCRAVCGRLCWEPRVASARCSSCCCISSPRREWCGGWFWPSPGFWPRGRSGAVRRSSRRRCGSTRCPGVSPERSPWCCWRWRRWRETASAACVSWVSMISRRSAGLWWLRWRSPCWPASRCYSLASCLWTVCVRWSSTTSGTRRSWRSSWSASACSAACTCCLCWCCWAVICTNKRTAAAGRTAGSAGTARNTASLLPPCETLVHPSLPEHLLSHRLILFGFCRALMWSSRSSRCFSLNIWWRWSWEYQPCSGSAVRKPAPSGRPSSREIARKSKATFSNPNTTVHRKRGFSLSCAASQFASQPP